METWEALGLPAAGRLEVSELNYVQAIGSSGTSESSPARPEAAASMYFFSL
jgi:hypothetical protein